MGYYIDLKNISIDKYKEILLKADLLPSRIILKTNIEEHFNVIKKQGVNNVEELMNALKTKPKLQIFANKSGIPETYLTILIREINSLRPNPNKIKDFPEIAENTIQKLEKAGMKTTLDLYSKVLTQKDRSDLAKQTGISENEILELAKLTDLSRVRWVNHTFARVLYEAGYDTAEKVAKADYNELYQKVKQLNAERNLFKGQIGLHDMKLCVEAAKGLRLEISWE